MATASFVDFTASEEALAHRLVAWEKWPGHASESDADDALLDIHHALHARGFTDGKAMSEAGRALLDRARRAGVL